MQRVKLCTEEDVGKTFGSPSTGTGRKGCRWVALRNCTWDFNTRGLFVPISRFWVTPLWLYMLGSYFYAYEVA